MRIRVDLSPRDDYTGELVVLVDVLRAGTTAPLLFDMGATEVLLTGSFGTARKSAGDGVVLVGDKAGVLPEGFNLPASPQMLLKRKLQAPRAVLVSENASALLPGLLGASEVLLASLFNAGALVAAIEELRPETVALVCAGYQGREDLDDLLAAGFITGQLQPLSDSAQLDGAARLGLSLVRAFPDPLDGLWYSAAGEMLRNGDLQGDLAIASQISQSPVVPRLSARSELGRTGLYSFERLDAPSDK